MSDSLLEQAKKVLMKEAKPLTPKEIWARGESMGIIKKSRNTGALASHLYTGKGEKIGIVRTDGSPARFYVKETQTGDDSPVPEDAKLEKDLHPRLANFAFYKMVRGKNIHTKTIPHQKSSHDGLGKKVHPDMVGVYMPFEPYKSWNKELIALNKIIAAGEGMIRLYSFEIKRTLKKSQYISEFFQAVANSSWAHESYLVAGEIEDDRAFMAELERLSEAFGVGVILLDKKNPEIKFPAKRKPSLDWETMNKLAERNATFRNFLTSVKNAFEVGKIHESEYDKVPEEDE